MGVYGWANKEGSGLSTVISKIIVWIWIFMIWKEVLWSQVIFLILVVAKRSINQPVVFSIDVSSRDNPLEYSLKSSPYCFAAEASLYIKPVNIHVYNVHVYIYLDQA